MNKNEVSLIAISVGILYLIITGIFTLLNLFITRIILMILTNNYTIRSFETITIFIPWIIFISTMLVVGKILLKSLNKGEHVYLLKNAMVRIITGVIIILDGGNNLFISLQANISMLNSSYTTLLSILGISMQLVQILLGIFMVIIYKQDI